MTIQVPSTAVEGAGSTAQEIVANPATSGVTDFLGNLYNNILLPVGTSVLKAKAEQVMAVGAAQAQAKVNQYHATDPSIGPNDPRAALAVSGQTLAQRWLPSFMLAPATVSTVNGQTVVSSPARVNALGWVAIGLLVVGVVWLLRRR